MKYQKEMTKLSKLMKTQDNRCGSYPFFIVYDRKHIPVDSDYSPILSCGDKQGIKTVFIYEEFEADSFEELTNKMQDNDYDIEGFEQSDAHEIDVQYLDIFKTICLSAKAAEEYIKQHGHNLNDPFVYGHSFDGNEEMEMVSKAIASLTPKVPPHKNGIGY